MAAMFLALCTHDIKVKGLDDAKCIIAAVYFTTINLLLVTMTFYVLREFLITYTAMFTLLIFFSTTVILGLVFIRQVIRRVVWPARPASPLSCWCFVELNQHNYLNSE